MTLRWTTFFVALVWTPAFIFAQAETPPSPSAAPADPIKTAAEQAYQEGDFAKCIELTTQAITKDNNDHLAYYLRASSRVELGQVQRDVKQVRSGIEDARESLRAIGKLEPNYYLPYLYGMTTLAQLENRPEHAKTAVDIADTLVKKNIPAEQKANIYYQRAVANLVRRQPQDAVKDYQAAIEAFPTHLGARIGLAESYVQANQPEKALEAYSAAVQAFPDNPLVYNNRGMFLQQRGQTKNAYADFTKAIELDPKFAVAITNRGFTSMNSGQHAAAEADFTAAMTIDADQPLPYSLRGTSRLAQGKIELALQDYLTVQKLDPQNPTTNADIGFAKLFAKDYAGAQTSFDTAMTADPNLRYLAPWRLWSGLLAGKTDAAAQVRESAAKPAEKRDWVDHLALYLTGEETEQQLLAAAKTKDANLQNAQQCEAYFFIAERKAKTSDGNGAAVAYKAALQTKAINLSAYRGAQFALQQFAK